MNKSEIKSSEVLRETPYVRAILKAGKVNNREKDNVTKNQNFLPLLNNEVHSLLLTIRANKTPEIIRIKNPEENPNAHLKEDNISSIIETGVEKGLKLAI